MKRRELFLLCFLSALFGGLVVSCLGRSPAQAAYSSDESTNINVYRQESPGVVNITSTTYVQDFFDVYPEKGTGSGSIIDAHGIILTNFHVVRGASDLQVTLADKATYKGRVVGKDPEDDLALVRIDAPPSKLHLIRLAAPGALQVGQKVLAIGNPFGLDHTLTTGIISGLGRPLKTDAGTTIENVIQTDAAINPGNSGGPLLNRAGELIGVNTAIYSPTGASVGIGFAIPVNVVKRVLPDLVNRGRVLRPWLGIAGTPLTPQIAHAVGLPVTQGVIITDMQRGGPADRAGLHASDQLQEQNHHWVLPADVIVKVAGEPTPDNDAIENVMMKLQPGQTITVHIARGHTIVPVRVKLQAKPAQ
ncbi:MAG: S1C family serine protease [Candidatus Xenobia bacterium]